MDRCVLLETKMKVKLMILLLLLILSILEPQAVVCARTSTLLLFKHKKKQQQQQQEAAHHHHHLILVGNLKVEQKVWAWTAREKERLLGDYEEPSANTSNDQTAHPTPPAAGSSA